MNRTWLFVCSCIALVTSAFTFIVRGDVLQDMGDAFQLTQQQKGGIEGAVFMGMALSMLAGGFICDLLGMKRIMILAFLCHLIGSLGTIFAPHSTISYYWLFTSSLLMGCGNGFTEVGINPLVATLYAHNKTHYLNILHAWWPGGLIIGGILARLVGKGLDLTVIPPIEGLGVNWQVSLCLIAGPAAMYGLMLIPSQFPKTERVQSGVSTIDMFKECLRPLFLIWAFCMLLTAATELGPQKWQESVIPNIAGVSGTLVLVYTSGMMFVLRHFAGPIAHRISPVGMMAGSALLSAVGLYLLSTATTVTTVFAYATIFGLGIAYFWPTMLGFTSERFPKGGALALALMGSAGNLSISQVLPVMGRIVDHFGVQELHALDGEVRAALEMPPAERDGEVEKRLAAVTDRLGGLRLSVADYEAAYSDPSLVARYTQEEFAAAVARARTLLLLPRGDRGTLQADPVLAALSGPLVEAFADESWTKTALNSQNNGPLPGNGMEAVRARLAETARRKAAARAFFLVDSVVANQALNVDTINSIAADFVQAMVELQQHNPPKAQALLAKERTRTRLKEFVELLAEATAEDATPASPAHAVRVSEARAQLTAALVAKDALNVEKLNGDGSGDLDEVKLRLIKLRLVKAAQATGYSLAFRFVSALPALLVVIFTGIILYDRARGGYKAEVLSGAHG